MTVPDNDLALLTIPEVADYLGIGISTVYEIVNRRELPVVDLGSTRPKQRVTRADLLAFIEARKHRAA